MFQPGRLLMAESTFAPRGDEQNLGPSAKRRRLPRGTLACTMCRTRKVRVCPSQARNCLASFKSGMTVNCVVISVTRKDQNAVTAVVRVAGISSQTRSLS